MPRRLQGTLPALQLRPHGTAAEPLRVFIPYDEPVPGRIAAGPGTSPSAIPIHGGGIQA